MRGIHIKLLFFTVLLSGMAASGQTRPGGANGRNASSSDPKPYSEVITGKAVTERGLITVHEVDDKHFFEIPDSLFGREILVVNRISKSAAGARAGFTGYAGDQISDNVIRFDRGPNNKVFMKSVSYQEQARDSTGGMYHSVRNSNLQPIVASFDIKAFGGDSLSGRRSAVVDVTDYLMGDNEILFFSSRIKRSLGLGQYQKDNSYILDILSFPSNTQIKTVKTYMRTPPRQNQGAQSGPPAPGSPATFELNSSMILLPEQPMMPRYFDPRVGYFATSYTDFDLNPQGVERVRMITRWRLEPKPEDIEKYKRGELVEPAKPIIFYIDPATPRKWVPYLIQGINDWQVAFEAAGFKNAIIGLEAPIHDPEWSIENAKYSAIVYKPSDIPNASGPHVHDPRSGEILESHINWYHNVMNLLRNWYFIQVAAVDPRARSMRFSDELMGELIRFVSSHEVGHTLGLRHNFGSSSTVPVENLRNKAWVEKHGHTPSIMDYARFNYIAQPEDNISEKGLFPRIGDYDIWAIKWGYTWLPEADSPEEEVPILNNMVINNLKDPRLWFGSESTPDDPRSQNEDLGNNAMIAGKYGIRNLQRIVDSLPRWTREPNEDYSNLDELYGQVVSQFTRYMGHAARNIGGIMTTPKTVEQEGVVVEFVAEAKQKEAMQFLHTYLFSTPTWLIDNNLSSYTNDNPLTIIGNTQNNILARLINAGTLGKLLRFEAEETTAYTANEMLTDLRRGIWSELVTKKNIDIYRRNLQKAFAVRLIDLANPKEENQQQGNNRNEDYKTNDVISLAKLQLRTLRTQIRAAIPQYADAVTKAHLMDIDERITAALDTGK